MSNAKEKIKEIATKEQKDAMKEMFRMVDKSKVDEVKQMLEYTQKGTAKATVGNYMVVLRNDPLVRESMKYNKLTGRIDIVKKLWWNEEVCKLDDDGRTYFYYNIILNELFGLNALPSNGSRMNHDTIKLEYGIKHQNIRNFLLVKKQI